MGLFNFVKDKGEELFNWATGETANQESETKIRDFVTKMGLEVTDFNVDVDGDKACITGSCSTQENREKVILAVGNVNGIAKVEDNLTVASSGTEATFYTVKGGDTLSKIAKEFYGDPMKYNTIFDANRPMLSDPDKIYPGQTLRIPEITATA